MADLREKLLEHRIRLRSYVNGSQKITCPECSHTRRNKADPCLSVTIDDEGVTWLCHHCSWSGGVKERDEGRPHYRRDHRAAPVKPTRKPGEITPEALAWLADRGISEAAARRNGVGVARTYLPGVGGEVDCLAFPYLRNGEVVNIKFRALASKNFAQVKGAEKIFFGLDDIAGSSVGIIVEGELDKLALDEAGLTNILSVPDGAPPAVKAGSPSADDRKFEYLGNCAEQLSQLQKIILAVDADEPGRALEEELARRLGKEQCFRVHWPTSGDAPCKDANDVLRLHGPEVLREGIALAEPFPIAGLHKFNDYLAEVIDLYRHGRSRGHSTGWAPVDDLMRIRPGELTVVTGVPNSGKSEFVDALMVNLAVSYDWRFAVCSFENPPAEHAAKLLEKYLGLPFFDGPSSRMSEADLVQAMEWVSDHFLLIRADDEAPTIDWVLDKAKAAVLRHGIRGLTLDPYNELAHQRPANQTETEYVSLILGKMKRFLAAHGVHGWLVAHPQKMQRDSSGKIPVPTLYDISGSANFGNKCDVGVVIHRDPNNDPTRTDVFVRKVRFKQTGRIGATSLRYDKLTGRYSEIPPAAPAAAARRHHDD
jgi:twinkle protein